MSDVIIVPGWRIICRQSGDGYTATVFAFSDIEQTLRKSMHFEKTEQAAIDAAKRWCADTPPF